MAIWIRCCMLLILYENEIYKCEIHQVSTSIWKVKLLINGNMNGQYRHWLCPIWNISMNSKYFMIWYVEVYPKQWHIAFQIGEFCRT